MARFFSSPFRGTETLNDDDFVTRGSPNLENAFRRSRSTPPRLFRTSSSSSTRTPYQDTSLDNNNNYTTPRRRNSRRQTHNTATLATSPSSTNQQRPSSPREGGGTPKSRAKAARHAFRVLLESPRRSVRMMRSSSSRTNRSPGSLSTSQHSRQERQRRFSRSVEGGAGLGLLPMEAAGLGGGGSRMMRNSQSKEGEEEEEERLLLPSSSSQEFSFIKSTDGFADVALEPSGLNDPLSSSPESEMKMPARASYSKKMMIIPSNGTHFRKMSSARQATPLNLMKWLQDEAPRDILPTILSFAGSRKIATLSLTSRFWRDVSFSEAVWKTLCIDTGKWNESDQEKEENPSLPPQGSWRSFYRWNPLIPVDYNSIHSALRLASSAAICSSAALARTHHDGDNDDNFAFDEDGDVDMVDFDRNGRERGHGAAGVLNNNVVMADNNGPQVANIESEDGEDVNKQKRSIRILLRAGKYVIRKPIVVHGVGNVSVTVETVENNRPRGYIGQAALTSVSTEEPMVSSPVTGESYRQQHRTRVGSSLRSMLTCRSSHGALITDASGHSIDGMSSMPELGDIWGNPSRSPDNMPRQRALIILKTRDQNEPIFRVRQGLFRLNRVDLVHNATGTDIWNGNTAVQVQPPFDAFDRPIRVAAPSLSPKAILNHVDVTSASGRGVVVIDGGVATIRSCHVHNCAATGIYVGGSGSVASVIETDVVRNGNGNVRVRRGGVARGHSGVYLEQGVTSIQNCNVSDNALTGITAVSADSATLTVERTDLVGNGSMQLELPPVGSLSRTNTIVRDNLIEDNRDGRSSGRSRSGLMPSDFTATPTNGTEQEGAQSPTASLPQSPREDINA